MKKKKMLALFLCVAMLLSACSGGGTETVSGENDPGGISESDTVTVAVATDPGSMFPYDYLNSTGRRIFSPVCEPLFIFDEDMVPQPGLATSVDVAEDGMNFTLHLREGVLFHNGQEMTAEDVKYSLERCGDSSQRSTMPFIDYENIEVVDDYTVYVPCTSSCGPIQSHLAVVGYVVCKSACEENPNYQKEMIGTGPFRFVSWTNDELITYEANEDYWGELPSYQNLVIRIIPDASAASSAVLTGEVDINLNVNNSDVVPILDGTNTDAFAYVGAPISTRTLIMNCTNEYLSNIQVRQAIACAIDRQAVIDTAYDGLGELLWSMITPYHNTFNEDLRNNWPYEYDVERAKSLLAEAGYPDGGFTLTAVLDETVATRTAMEVIGNMLSQVGITLEIQQYESTTYTDVTTNSNDYDIIIDDMNQNGDPANALLMLYDPENGVIGGSNFSRNIDQPNADVFREALIAATSSVDEQQRINLYAEAQEIAVENVWTIPISATGWYAIYGKNVEGFWFAGVHPHYENIQIVG